MGSAASGYIAILSDVTLPIVPMLIFSVFSLVAGSLIMFLPETQGIPLPDTIWVKRNFLIYLQKWTEIYILYDVWETVIANLNTR